MSVMVSIALHGLIALVPVNVAGDGTLTPGGLAGANHMAALLVDAHDTNSIDQTINCITRHDPYLEFTIPDSSISECEALDWCDPLPPEDGQPRRCACIPVGKKIWLTPDNSPSSPQPFQPWAATDLPPDHHPEFTNFPNITHLGWNLDTRHLNQDTGALAGRMVFPFDQLTTCALAVRPGDRDQDNVHSFGFRKLNEVPNAQVQPHQAVAQRLLARNLYQIADQPLQIHFSDLNGSNEETVTLAQSGDVEIDLENEREHLELDDPCNDGVGRDFALFYKLTTNPRLGWTEVPLPHLIPTVAKLDSAAEDPVCLLDPGKGMMSRPICTMASFIQ